MNAARTAASRLASPAFASAIAFTFIIGVAACGSSDDPTRPVYKLDASKRADLLAAASPDATEAGGDDMTAAGSDDMSASGDDAGMSGGDDAGMSGGDDAAMTVDFAGGTKGDMASGGACKSACDCPTGKACSAGKCVTKISPIYCCTMGQCPTGKSCDYPNGTFGKCGGGPVDFGGPKDGGTKDGGKLDGGTKDGGSKTDGGPKDGGADAGSCVGLSCSKSGVKYCVSKGCTMCVAGMKGMVCAK